MLKYCIDNCGETCQSYKSFSVAIIHLLKDLLNRENNENKRPFVLRIIVQYANSLLPVDTPIDMVFIDNQLNGWSTMNGQFCLASETESETELREFLNLYQDEEGLDKSYMHQAVFYLVNRIDALKKGIGRCINRRSTKSSAVLHVEKRNDPIATKVIKRLILPEKKDDDVAAILKKISDKIENNTTSLICPKASQCNRECDIPSIEVKKTRNVDLKDDEEVKKVIDDLELAKQMADSAINKFSSEVESEKDKLNEYINQLNVENVNSKKEEEAINRKVSIFLADKESTYKMVLNAIMNDTKFGDEIDLNKVPPLFLSKFPIFLFMDGKDLYGNTVRDGLLDTENEYHIFTLLHDSLSNEFEMPEDDEDVQLISDFMDFLPAAFQPKTGEEIMELMNEQDKENECIFKESTMPSASRDSGFSFNAGTF